MPGPVLEQKTYLQLTRRQRVYLKVKRVMDVLLSGAGLVVLSPLFLGVILAIKLEDGWRAPVFFSQKRVGNHKCYFQLYKFRSMKLDAPHDMPTHLLRDPEQYITKVGKVLRRTSLDELPQIWNILKGDMSDRSAAGSLESGGPAGRA